MTESEIISSEEDFEVIVEEAVKFIKRRKKAAKTLLKRVRPQDFPHILERMPEEDRLQVVLLLPDEILSEFIAKLPQELIVEMISKMEKNRLIRIASEITEQYTNLKTNRSLHQVL